LNPYKFGFKIIEMPNPRISFEIPGEGVVENPPPMASPGNSKIPRGGYFGIAF
jgi:hypothetical protein